MDERAPLAQSLKPKPARRAVADTRLHAHGWPGSGWGWLRLVRRWYTTLIELDVPRGAGSSAAALLLLASASYGAVKGDHVQDIAAGLPDIANQAAVTVGFGINEVALSGQHEATREDILRAARFT